MVDRKITPDDLLKPHELRPESLKALIGSIEKSKGRIVGWERFGQPKIDRVVARIEASPSSVGALAESLVAQSDVNVRLDILVNGIPPIERMAEIRAEIKSPHVH
jgi:hypothetical protein